MTKKEFDKYLARDLHCYHCGLIDDTLVPQHRLGRGMGGKNKQANQVSNIIVFCSEANGLIESSSLLANMARTYGWKLRAGQEPANTPIYDCGKWYLLTEDFRRIPFEIDTEYF